MLNFLFFIYPKVKFTNVGLFISLWTRCVLGYFAIHLYQNVLLANSMGVCVGEGGSITM